MRNEKNFGNSSFPFFLIVVGQTIDFTFVVFLFVQNFFCGKFSFLNSNFFETLHAKTLFMNQKSLLFFYRCLQD